MGLPVEYSEGKDSGIVLGDLGSYIVPQKFITGKPGKLEISHNGFVWYDIVRDLEENVSFIRGVGATR